MEQPVLYAEPGASWWPLLWGPVFVLVGVLVEAVTGGVWFALWAVVGLVLTGSAALWVAGRRRVYGVRLTPVALRLGQEELPVRDIAEVEGVEPRAGAKVLGGGWTVPRGTSEVPVRLQDGTVVTAWAHDPDALRGAVHRLLSHRT
ncbi:DUF3093 family protein [Actinosynnema sp. CA-248983]